MLGNCEKMVAISSTTNGWPQNQIDEKGLMASTGRVMEKTSQDQSQNQNQNHQQVLKCPRCDSSNTKFCYYNNYSLSQPRHFCKACKRYWTRGGTLRNVPVGGGCRKNKRVKRPASSSDAPPSSISTPNPNNVQPHQIDISSTSNHMNHPLFYGLPTNPSELSLPYPCRFNSRVPNVETVSAYDLHPQLSNLGLGFPTGLVSAGDHHVGDYDHHHHHRNGYNNPATQIQDVVTSNSLLSSYNSIFGSSTPTSTSVPTMASLIASSLHQQQKSIRAANNFHGLVAYEDLQMPGSGKGNNIAVKEVKMEENQYKLDWNVSNCQQNHQIEQINSSSDPSLYNWNATAAGAWLDPANMGPSVPSLI